MSTYEPQTIRSQCIQQQADLLEQAKTTLTAKGCTVHVASTAQEAAAILSHLCGSDKAVCTSGAELTEIDLSTAVPQALQTDLEAVVATALHRPVQHPHQAPLENVSSEQITDILRQYVGEAVAPEALLAAATTKIKSAADQSTWGITNADGIAADTGTLIIAEDQGNGRIVSNIPARHIAVVGLEKLYPSNDTALEAIHASWQNGGRRSTPTYYSYITGPSRTGDIEGIIVCGMHGPLAVDVILLDNGRSQLMSQGKGKVLQCIDCGKCTAALRQLLADGSAVPAPLTCKSLALAAAKGSITIQPEAWSSCSFDCPVGMTPEDVQQAL